MVMIVVVILVVSAMIGQLAQRVVRDARQARQQLMHRQTQELAAAGVHRLALQRQISADWQGETWLTTVTSDSQTNDSEVVITVNGNTATVVARYPLDSPTPVQVTRQVELEQQ